MAQSTIPSPTTENRARRRWFQCSGRSCWFLRGGRRRRRAAGGDRGAGVRPAGAGKQPVPARDRILRREGEGAPPSSRRRRAGGGLRLPDPDETAPKRLKPARACRRLLDGHRVGPSDPSAGGPLPRSGLDGHDGSRCPAPGRLAVDRTAHGRMVVRRAVHRRRFHRSWGQLVRDRSGGGKAPGAPDP